MQVYFQKIAIERADGILKEYLIKMTCLVKFQTNRGKTFVNATCKIKTTPLL